MLPLSNVSLLGDYAFGSGNSKQEILIPHSWEVTGLHNCATIVNQQLKDLLNYCLGDVKPRYWTGWWTSEAGWADFQIAINNFTCEVDGQHFENRIKS